MKYRLTAFFLSAVLLLSCAASAAALTYTCLPEETFQAVFSLTPESGKPDAVVGQLEYDSDVFEILLAGTFSVTSQGGIFFYGGQSVHLSFRVRKFVPDGIYPISVRVISVEGGQADMVSVNPVEVLVGKAVTPTPKRTATPKPGAAYSPEKDFEYQIKDDSVIIIRYTGHDPSVNIPKTIAGKPVTRIGNSAFYRNTSLVYVQIPYGVTSIGQYAFAECTGLTNVIIPDSMTSIDNYAFSKCTSLTRLFLSANIRNIASNTFYQANPGLVLVVPNGSYALDYCIKRSLAHRIQ